MYILTEGGWSFKTVVTYLLKNVKHGIEHDIDSTYGDSRLS